MVVASAYDAAGNLTNDGLYYYKHDPRNRLVEVRCVAAGCSDDSNLAATYTYDGEVSVAGNVPRRQFVWGGQYIDEAICMVVDTEWMQGNK